jgi:hemerythrin superfamily protein
MPNHLQKMASDLGAAAKDVKAAVRGLSGVFRHLMEEHGKVMVLIRRVLATSDDGVRAKLYPQIRSELLTHENGELNAVYSVLAEYDETRDIAAAHTIESSDMQAALLELDAISIGEAKWAPTFERLARLVAEHVRAEESRYFPLAQKVIGEERAEQLIAAYEAAKRVS